MNLGQLRAETFRRLNEASPSVVWTDAEVDESINLGLEEISDETEWFERVQQVDVMADHQYYDMRHVLLHPLLVIGAAFNINTNRWLRPISTRELDGGDHRWEQRVAEPEFLLPRSLWMIGYWPFRGADGAIRQYYTSLPDRLVFDYESPGFPDQYHYGLVEFALCELWGMDAEADLATAAWKEYLSYEAALRLHVTERAKTPLRRGLSEEYR